VLDRHLDAGLDPRAKRRPELVHEIADVVIMKAGCVAHPVRPHRRRRRARDHPIVRGVAPGANAGAVTSGNGARRRARRGIEGGMKLYTYAASANGYKVELALAQLGIEHERVEVAIFRGESRTSGFLRKNPDGRIPVLELDDGTTLPESNAILWYVARGTRLAPAGAVAEARALAWMFFEQNAVEPVIGSARFWRLTGRDRDRADEIGRRIEQGRGALRALDRHLAGRSFLVDDRYTIADIAVYAYGHLAPDVGIALDDTPHVAAWCRRVEEQPGWFPGPAPYGADAMVA